MAGEFAALDRIRRLLPPPPAGETWMGDDAAVVASPPGPLLLATDVVVAGVHADLSLTGLDDLGWKALAVNVSDLAAMGGRPLHALVGVAGPPGTDLALLYRGLAEAALAYACPIVGGDLANAPTLMVAVAMTGTVDGRPVLRSGARPGHAIFLTGTLGWSALGLRRLRAGAGEGVSRVDPADPDDPAVRAHRRPSALVAEGEAARRGGASAMVDISDGLGADLGHVADASGVGFALHELPVAPGASRAEALGGGEDYALVMCAPHPERLTAAFAQAGLAPPLHIGTCTADAGRRTLAGEDLAPAGYEHHW